VRCASKGHFAFIYFFEKADSRTGFTTESKKRHQKLACSETIALVDSQNTHQNSHTQKKERLFVIKYLKKENFGLFKFSRAK
jgi:hypothetical protein